ncbi:hypothetical protein CKF54_02555 [Psittacicella hinzii]|uniref:Nudix hydrolase domain-containing protein n=1 Tax=Psittacicella hinzii TaxID=2028575 RepID=A0A3A1YBW2_9GAMM|nr:NUDIX domain-containing protein [Psittacicella hinzii]RIY33597.1 hypothetical protein CKF54_02555 [Psittacicella hinzii]
MDKFPKVSNLQYLGKLGIFNVEILHLQFANGVERDYFRLASKRDAVTVVALDKDDVLCIREFAGGTLNYELGFVRGGVEADETIFQAAERELAEEIGYRANKLVHVSTTSSNPGYSTGFHHIVIASELEALAEKPEGDEPEPLELVRWPLDKLMDLRKEKDFRDTTHRLALFELEMYLKDQQG